MHTEEKKYNPAYCSPKTKVLVIDDEKNIRATLAICLESMGYEVKTSDSAESAIKAVSNNYFDIAFLDLRLGASDGLDLIPELLSENPEISIIVITAYATFETAVEAIRRGAKNYLPKPFTPGCIRHVLEQLAEHRDLTQRIMALETMLSEAVPEANLETDSPAMKSAMKTLSKAAVSDAAILLRGENGTGKGVMARTVHLQSMRANRPFIVVNCPTLSDELLASELFGHRKGSFTGAVNDQPGRVEAAEGGTLFLDEIGEISPGLQAKLLRFLQEKQFERIGENRTRIADVRVITATNRNLEADVTSGRFREDLFYRINVIEVMIPPLRERPEDLVRLARSFINFFAKKAGKPSPELSDEASQALLSYSWPGNIRELRNAMERSIIIWPGQTIGVEMLPERISGNRDTGMRIGGNFTIEELEKEHVSRIVDRTPTLEDAARILGVDSSTLWRKRKKYADGN